ncbi:hypothetical protein QL285_052697 [Trifolium repens]|nr:hypothetical protein QL285_052697 [Trifolium repens]
MFNLLGHRKAKFGRNKLCFRSLSTLERCGFSNEAYYQYSEEFGSEFGYGRLKIPLFVILNLNPTGSMYMNHGGIVVG